MRDSSIDLLVNYISKGNRDIAGWFARVDAEIFRAILMAQIDNNLRGSVAEIGVHHGKSLIALCLGLRGGEKAYCIDIFEDQHLNIDKSGHGERRILENNLKKFSLNNICTIDHRSSQDVHPGDINSAVGKVRFFSIDGGHWLEIVKNDLSLAEKCIAEHGVIALDDFCRPEWPNVSAGYFEWRQSQGESIFPFAIGFNKLYLCQRKWVEFYKKTLSSDPFLSFFLTKHIEFQKVDVPVFQQYILPEMSFFARTLACMRVFEPNLFVKLVRFKSSGVGAKLHRIYRHFTFTSQ